MPLLGAFALNLQVKILAVAFLLFLIAGAFVALEDNRAASHGNGQLALVGEMRTLSQQVARAIQGALTGQAAAMADLRTSRDRFAQLFSLLANGGEQRAVILPPLSPQFHTELEDLRAKWDLEDRNLQVLLTQEKALVALGKLVSDITEQSPRAADLAAQAGGGLPLLIERIGRNATLLLTLTAVDEAPANQLSKDIAAAVDASARSKDGELQGMLKGWQEGLRPISAEIKPLLQAKQAAGHALRHSGNLRDAADRLGDRIDDQVSGRGSHFGMVAACGAAALLMLVLIVKVVSDDAVIRREAAEHQRRQADAANAATQQALKRLVDAVVALGEGDLTQRLAVPEDNTAPIAATLNANSEEMAALVARIHNAAQRVDKATRQAADTNEELLVAADTQTDQIRHINGLALSLAATLGQMMEKAKASAAASLQAREGAERGGVAVAQAVADMNEMGRQVEASARRVKRLGDTSREIGEVVDLIADISEQTNVLALNAAIQAASAGEVGRGFAVVAEEVQHLAERSAEASKQIAGLVRSIHNDSQEAVVTMEHTAQNALKGARLSDAAGQALNDVAAAARDLAAVIEGFSGECRLQGDLARQVAEALKEVQRLTEQTSAGTQLTAGAIADLNGLAGELNATVARFKV